eukprot:CAMPEP_0116831788 /NCGR_PEP_ID=MMETSP0418-20121206/5533_1 /TAXON_ID=1158023 /ORGANISM="Astrosyne radiata, Strain 13vi08-1A" /LENGTH=138 /DNA_ID=CAMNT_0004461081 /DNA_START=274 /DNA_END=687 /DNA_ORIENTATION=+
MFVASCDYVRRLIPPKDFEVAKFRAHERGVLDNPSSPWHHLAKHDYDMDRIAYIGLHRYAAEHWIGSHPDLRPVSVMPFELQFEMETTSFNMTWKPELQNYISKDGGRDRFGNTYYRLEGRLHIYDSLYNASPPADSW